MKKILLFMFGTFGGIIAFSHIYPDNTQTASNLNQASPNIAKTAYLTNVTEKLMQAYPNPAKDVVIIQHMASTDRAVIYVINTDGKILQQQTVMPSTLQTDLHIGSLSRGIYIVRFDNARGDVRTLKLVKD
jgi:hypothetical protein